MNIKRLPIVALIAAIMAGYAVNAQAATPKAYGLSHPFVLSDLPKSDFRDQLKALPAKQRAQAMKQLHTFDFTAMDVPAMKVDKAGGVFYVDEFQADATLSDTTSDPSVSAITATDAFSLHSKPGASNVVYLDFTGHTLTNTAWNSYTGAATLTALPYDLDGSPTTFSDAELANIAEIWRRIAEDYAPFNIDITTQEPSTFSTTTGRVLITQDTDASGQAMPAQGAGGVAYVGVWGLSNYSTYYSPALVYFNRLGGGRADYVTEAASHELGHNLGLSHDGTSTLGYFGGMGSGYVSWGPIMGTGYGRNVSQWSKGEYTDANNQQDDIAVITGKVGVKADDHANTTSGATPLVMDSLGNIASTTPETDPSNASTDNKGVISSRTDIDVFSFKTAGGNVTLAATPAFQSRYTRGGNLDIELSLYDANGNLVTSSEPVDDTNASISTSLAAGSYFLAVHGVGNSITPYSDYGSLGQYFLSGNVPPDTSTPPDPVNNAPVANADSYALKLSSTNTLSVLVNDTDADGDALTITAVTKAAKGTVSISADAKSLTYVAGRKRGGDTLTYTISDGNGGTATGTVSINLK